MGEAKKTYKLFLSQHESPKQKKHRPAWCHSRSHCFSEAEPITRWCEPNQAKAIAVKGLGPVPLGPTVEFQRLVPVAEWMGSLLRNVDCMSHYRMFHLYVNIFRRFYTIGCFARYITYRYGNGWQRAHFRLMSCTSSSTQSSPPL